MAFGALRVLIATATNLPRSAEISINPAVLLFTFAISLCAGVAFGLIAVLKYATPDLAFFLGATGRSPTSGRERQLTRNILAAAQLAFALVLLVGSVLMIRTFQQLKHVDPGFVRPSEVETLHIYISPVTRVTLVQ